MEPIESHYLKIIAELGSLRVRRNEDLANHTTFKVGGPADLFFVAKTIADLVHAIRETANLKIPVLILGSGSNVIVGDKGFRGLVIKNRCEGICLAGYAGRKTKTNQHGAVVVEAESGTHLQRLKRWTIEQGWGGLEFLDGVPGTVGAAVRLNVHDRHIKGWERYLSEVLLSADLISLTGATQTVDKAYFEFSQLRRGWQMGSKLMETGEIVLKARFGLKKTDPEILWSYVRDYTAWRLQHQPQGLPSSGSFFSNPGPNISAGKLIDQAGLRGTRVGDVAVSETHANFLVNCGSAQAADVVGLARLIKKRVREKFGIELEEEIDYVGDF